MHVRFLMISLIQGNSYYPYVSFYIVAGVQKQYTLSFDGRWLVMLS